MNLQYPLNSKFHAYRHIQIIKCKQNKIVIIGWDANQQQYGALIFNKVKSTEQNRIFRQIINEVGPVSSYQLIKFQIQKKIGNFHSKQSIFGFGIVGFHKFLQGYYMTYISQIQACAKIGKHKVYTIKNTGILALFEYQVQRKIRKNEQKYLEILTEFKLENFYFSDTYDLSNSLAKNMIRNSRDIFGFSKQDTHPLGFGQKIKKSKTQTLPSYKQQQKQFFRKDDLINGSQMCGQRTLADQNEYYEKVLECSDIFTFNYELIKEFYQSINNKRFVLPVVHGYCKHINVNLKSTIFNIVVIARRSRYHAGTRYIKRGIGPKGYVANFVQVQQIAINHSSSQDSRPVCSSFVQVRGSVPTYWMQRPSIHIPKPAIQVKHDDYMFLASRKHFFDMISRYGNLIYAVNLMRKNEKVARQSLLSNQYDTAVQFINRQDLKQQNEIHYVEMDMKYHLRLDKKLFVNKMKTIAYFAIQNTGLFLCMNPSTSCHEQFIEIQNGVIRANCVDCLDRTNSFQQLMGETALAIQLNRLIKQDVTFESLQLPELILSQYSKLYEEMGDLISIQYGSSLAHKQKIKKSTESRFQFLIAITRHVNNNWNDYDRQQQMDVFLGYKPDLVGPQIWDVKPAIEHYPNKELQIFQRNNWYEEAFQNFLKSHMINNFRQINNRQDYQRSIPHVERLMKEDLVSKFNVDVVTALVNQRQVFNLLQFFVTPKISSMKNLLSFKKIKKIQNIKQELQYCYNKLDFLKSEQGQKILQISQKQIRTGLPNEIRKNFGAKTSKPLISFYLDERGNNTAAIMKGMERVIQGNCLDQADCKIIDRYMLGELIQDTEIQDQIENYTAFLNGDIQIDWPTDHDIQKQLKLLETNMANKNYINYSEVSTESSSTDLLRKKKKTVMQNSLQKIMKTDQKNQKMKQNKILILEQIMKKNFSHGNVQKIQEI